LVTLSASSAAAVVGARRLRYRLRMQEQKGNIPYYAFRLEDLRAWHVVVAVCGQCRHEAPLRHQQLTSRRARHILLRDLERRLRCRRCGNSRHNRFSVRLARRD
jgi:hypothetical protein